MGLLALSGGQMLAISGVAVVFIVFALLSSFLLPRRNPDFPGNRVGLFALASVLLFLAMVGAMFAFAVENEEAAGHDEPAHTETAADTGAATTPEEPGVEEGDLEAGRQVFADAGCAACHTLAEAGASGQVGPNLDEAQPSFELAVDRVTNGQGAMPAFAGQLSEEQIRDVARFVADSAGGG
jgi:mono/diheme cytochrome c family protein